MDTKKNRNPEFLKEPFSRIFNDLDINLKLVLLHKEWEKYIFINVLCLYSLELHEKEVSRSNLDPIKIWQLNTSLMEVCVLQVLVVSNIFSGNCFVHI